MHVQVTIDASGADFVYYAKVGFLPAGYLLECLGDVCLQPVQIGLGGHQGLLDPLPAPTSSSVSIELSSHWLSATKLIQLDDRLGIVWGGGSLVWPESTSLEF